jgi:hypothetical protein
LTDAQWGAVVKEMGGYMAEKQNPRPRYPHIAVHQMTGHKIGSHDGGQTWFDHETGEPLK